MKRILLLALVLCLTLGIAGIANGALITSVDTTSWIFGGAGITKLYFQNALDLSVPYAWNSGSLTINGFTLDQNNNVISVQENIELGSFNTVYSSNLYGLNQYFMLESDLSNRKFNVGFAISNPEGKFAISSSTLTVDYTNNGAPISNPEPGTIILLGSSLVGLAVWGRKKSRK